MQLKFKRNPGWGTALPPGSILQASKVTGQPETAARLPVSTGLVVLLEALLRLPVLNSVALLLPYKVTSSFSQFCWSFKVLLSLEVETKGFLLTLLAQLNFGLRGSPTL